MSRRSRSRSLPRGTAAAVCERRVSPRGVHSYPARWTGVPVALALLAAMTSFSEAQTAPGNEASVFNAISGEVREVFGRCREAVVKIEAVDRHGPLSGTGFFIDPKGTIYTSYSIGGASSDIVVRMGNRKYPATRIVSDSRSGVAILKVEAETPFLPTGTSKDLSVASPVIAIGYPMDLPVSPSFGFVAGFDLKYLGRFFSTTHIRATVPVQRGEGGAPLLNLKGEAVGILISSLEQSSGCFALPIEAAEKIRKDFVRFGETRPGWLGIDVGSSDSPEREARILDFLPGAPAAKSGLRKGDVLVEVDGMKIEAAQDILNAGFFLTAGDLVSLVVERDGKRVPIKLRAGAVPSSTGDPLHALAVPAPKGGLEFNPE